MRRFYLALSIVIVALGLLHVGSTPGLFAELNSRALWFASGGLTLILLGTLNLLNHAYGNAARGLKWTCLASNLVILAFSALSGFVGGASVGEMITVLSLLVATAFLSISSSVHRSSQRETSAETAPIAHAPR